MDEAGWLFESVRGFIEFEKMLSHRSKIEFKGFRCEPVSDIPFYKFKQREVVVGRTKTMGDMISARYLGYEPNSLN